MHLLENGKFMKKERKNSDLPLSQNNKVSKFAHLTFIKCLKPLSFGGSTHRPLHAYVTVIKCLKPLNFWRLRPVDPTPIHVLPVSQIRYQNMLI